MVFFGERDQIKTLFFNEKEQFLSLVPSDKKHPILLFSRTDSRSGLPMSVAENRRRCRTRKYALPRVARYLGKSLAWPWAQFSLSLDV
jgi:hypothetical protein